MAELKPVYLLAGADRPKIARALERLRARFDSAAVEALEAAETSGADAVATCNALGLFGGSGRLVLVRDVHRWKVDDAKAIAEYLKTPAPETVLALVGEEVKKDSALAKACAKAGEVLVYDVAKRDLARWVAEQFQRAGAKADAAACRALIELVGDNLDELALEVEKLATWAGDAEIGEADVEILVAARAEVPPFALADAWGRRDVAGALRALETALERSSPRDRSLPGIVGRLAGHIRRVRTCQALEAEGISPRDAATRLKIHPFAAEKAFSQAENFTRGELEDAVVRLAELDLATKGGSRLPDELSLERALVDVTRPREPAPRERQE